MTTQENIIVSETDFKKILTLIKSAPTLTAELLEEELGRASLVSDEELPDDVVGMNATIAFEDIAEKKTSTVSLVYPHEANIEENKISILTPIGSALIGLRVGQSIRWPLPNGKEKHLRVLSVKKANI